MSLHDTTDRPQGVRIESDPYGKAPNEGGAKLDAGKNRLGLVLGGFPRALAEVGKVGTYGANKYSDNGWMQVPQGKQRYTDAMLRHVFKSFTGEMCDPDTGLTHAAHAAWNALATLELMCREMEQDKQIKAACGTDFITEYYGNNRRATRAQD